MRNRGQRSMVYYHNKQFRTNEVSIGNLMKEEHNTALEEGLILHGCIFYKVEQGYMLAHCSVCLQASPSMCLKKGFYFMGGGLSSGVAYPAFT